MTKFTVLLSVVGTIAAVSMLQQLPDSVQVTDRPIYDVKNIVAPIMTGVALRIFSWATETYPLSLLIINKIKADSEFHLPRLELSGNLAELSPTFLPSMPVSAAVMKKHEHLASQAANLTAFAKNQPTPHGGVSGFRFLNVDDFAQAYRNKETTPLEVAKQFIAFVAESEQQFDHPLRVFLAIESKDLLEQARLSTERFQQGKPLSWFDGVPVAVKDELMQKGYPTTGGVSFLSDAPAETEDAHVVEKLRLGGALLVGKANMHEIGLGVTGLNPWHGFARNPYNVTHVTGGSSSGSASSVAAGLTPISIGADGGGSIRIPAGLCGAFGLKATFGRVSEHGAFQICWSVAHIGPMATNAKDLAASYMMVAGKDSHDVQTLAQPPVHLHGFDDISSFRGLRVGVFDAYNKDSSPAMQAATQQLVDSLVSLGATVVPITIPNMQMINRAHAITISTEMAAAMGRFKGHEQDFGLDVRVYLALAKTFSAVDYIASQKVRTYTMNLLETIFADQVDVIVTPNQGITSPAIPVEAIPEGIADSASLSALMRYAVIPNLTGHPAVTIPITVDNENLPVSVQVIGRYWEEHQLLRIAHLADHRFRKNVAVPQAHYAYKLKK